jgi:serine/threonine protein kinase
VPFKLLYCHSIILSSFHFGRDIKGANILVDPNGEIKLADFGMAKHVSSSDSVNNKLVLAHFKSNWHLLFLAQKIVCLTTPMM